MWSLAGPIVALTAFLVGALGFVAASQGHALQPGYLELRLIDKDLYAVVWKIPASGARPMAIAANCRSAATRERRGSRSGTAAPTSPAGPQTAREAWKGV